MLSNVVIKNMALIKEANIDFTRGLNVLTGETGAGKSIIISAINLALGNKADRSMIRSDCDYGAVELLFCDVDENVLQMLDEYDIERDGANVILSRKVTPDSSVSKINGQIVTLTIMKHITGILIDIHGQHDHQSLLDPSKHIELLDDAAKEDVSAIKEKLKDEFSTYRTLRKEYLSYDKTEEELAHDIELFKYELKEIDEADIACDEDKKLEEEFKLLSSNEKITELVGRAYSNFGDFNDSLNNRIFNALKDIDAANQIDNDLGEIKNILMDLESVSQDALRMIEAYIKDHGFDPERYALVKSRLDEINHIKAKYGKSIEMINEYRREIEEKINSFDDYFDKKRKLEDAIHSSGERLNELSCTLSDIRKKNAVDFESAVKENLNELNFINSEFKVDIQKLDKITEKGFDKIEFMISANPGEPLMPLAKIASGGEISRIMLAIKSSAAGREDINTLIFDEIDSGISGKTAQAVAEKLYDLSKTHQIICISHLPQIAAMADSHFHIHKEVEGQNTISGIERLTDEQMIKEIAKLVGGSEVSRAALENARDLKGNANFFKRKLT